MATISQLREGLTILEKYCGRDDPCVVGHDIIYAGGVEASKMSDEDAKRIDELGWHWDDEFDCWARFT